MNKSEALYVAPHYNGPHGGLRRAYYGESIFARYFGNAKFRAYLVAFAG